MFQRLMNQILHPKLDSIVMVYLDNILIYTPETKEKHEKEVGEVLQILKESNIMLNSKKSKFSRNEITFLRTIISDKRLRMEIQKMKAIYKWPALKMVKKVQVFLGFANYYWWFIRNYSWYTTPLMKLIKKDQAFEWGKE